MSADLAFATMMTLTACGGGGGGSPTPPGVIPPPAPIDPPPPTDPTPPPASNAGRFAISGIEKIPQDMLKMTNKEMQKKWVISETWPEHGRTVSRVACQSYVTNSPQCERDSWARKTHSTDGTVVIRAGNSPFTELLDLKEIAPGNRPPEYLWIMGEAARMGAKIVTSTSSGNTFVRHDNLPYLVVASAGNGKSDFSWLQDQSEFGGNAADQRYVQRTVRSAVAADKLLFVAGYDKNAAGNYVRHWWSSGCKDSELVNGCLWTRFDFLDVGV